MEVVINLIFINLSLKILCTCSKQYWLLWMWLQDVLFYMCKMSYLLEFYCWKVEMVRHWRITSMCSVIFLMWMVKLTFIWLLFLPNFVVCWVGKPQGLPPCWFVINVHKIGRWSIWHHHCKKFWSTNDFVFSAPNKPRFLFL
jgi:hypothetical protein